MIRGLVVKFFYVMFHSIIRTKVIGRENIPENGAAILCSNHIHFFDSVSIVVHNKRMVYIIAKEELLKNAQKYKNNEYYGYVK